MNLSYLASNQEYRNFNNLVRINNTKVVKLFGETREPRNKKV